METKSFIVGSEIYKQLEKISQQHQISIEDLLSLSVTSVFTNSIDLKLLEVHEGSIITQGLTLADYWKPEQIVFRTKHNRHKVKVTDALITPELAIFYVDKDTRKWPHTKGCTLLCDRQKFYFNPAWFTISSTQGTIHFQHDPLLDNP